jgi:hypothetical protein
VICLRGKKLTLQGKTKYAKDQNLIIPNILILAQVGSELEEVVFRGAVGEAGPLVGVEAGGGERDFSDNLLMRHLIHLILMLMHLLPMVIHLLILDQLLSRRKRSWKMNFRLWRRR